MSAARRPCHRGRRRGPERGGAPCRGGPSRDRARSGAGAPGGRCRSYLDQTLGLTIDNGNHLLLSGNHAALDYLDRIGARGTLPGPGAAIFDFADLASGERWRLRFERRAPPVVAVRPQPTRARNRVSANIWRRSGCSCARQGATVGEAMRCAGPLYERLWRPLLLAGLNTEPQESSAALAAALMRETLGAGGRACHPLVAAHGLSQSFIDPALAFHRRARRPRRASASACGRFASRGAAPSPSFSTASAGARRRRRRRPRRPAMGRRRTSLPGLDAPDEFRAIVNAHFRVAPPPGQPPILGVVNGLSRMAVRLPGPPLGDDQRRRPADR